jgi:hypothetical protein
MQNFKNRLYDFETPPPGETWQKISDDLYDEKITGIYKQRRPRWILYGVSVAASLILIFLGSGLFKKNTGGQREHTSSAVVKGVTPSEQKIKDSVNLNRQILRSIINSPAEKRELVRGTAAPAKKYLTVAGPEGQPVRISAKVATLIISADNEYPPRPVWSKKINKWQKIMLSSTISSTTNLFDLAQLATGTDKLD